MNDMMQCVKCNKSSLFALRVKALERQGKGKYLREENKIKCF
jgi:stalled ribosome alternative rescue factor ArfA